MSAYNLVAQPFPQKKKFSDVNVSLHSYNAGTFNLHRGQVINRRATRQVTVSQQQGALLKTLTPTE